MDVPAGDFDFTKGTALNSYGPHDLSGSASTTVGEVLYEDSDTKTQITCAAPTANLGVEVSCSGTHVVGHSDVPTTVNWTFNNEQGTVDVPAGDFDFTKGTALNSYGPHDLSGSASTTVGEVLYSDSDSKEQVTCGEKPAFCDALGLNPSEGHPSLDVTATVTATDALKLRLNWGDNSPITEETSLKDTHSYTQTGNFKVVAEVLGADGVWRSSQACEGEVTVTEEPTPPFKPSDCVKLEFSPELPQAIPSEGFTTTITMIAKNPQYYQITSQLGTVNSPDGVFHDFTILPNVAYFGVAGEKGDMCPIGAIPTGLQPEKQPGAPSVIFMPMLSTAQ